MNQLIKQEANLPPLQMEFISLRAGNKSVKDLSDSVVKRTCAEILTKASFDMGSPMANDAKILQFQTEALFNELKGKFGALTLPEVNEAFRRGIRGESGPFFGMCPKTYHQFIKWFFDLPERGKAWIEYLNSLDQIKIAEKPLYVTPEYLKKAALDAFQEYKDSGKLPFIGHAIYDTIKEIKGLETLIDKLDWEQIKIEARESYGKEMTRGTAKHKVDKVVNSLVYEMSNRSFEFHVKKIGLKYYFDNLIKSGKDLEL
jgi:hypothetical protein